MTPNPTTLVGAVLVLSALTACSDDRPPPRGGPVDERGVRPRLGSCPGDFVEFGVKGVGFAGSLDGTTPTSTVLSLYNGICGSP